MSEYNQLVKSVMENWNSKIVDKSVNPFQEAYNQSMASMDLLIKCIQCGAASIALIGKGYCQNCVADMKAPTPPSRAAAQKAVEKLKATSNKSTQELLAKVCDDVKEMLLEKNRAYGDSALNPVRIFSKASPREQLLVRLDDKLSRLVRGEDAGEDVIDDAIGYLILLKVHDEMSNLVKEM